MTRSRPQKQSKLLHSDSLSPVETVVSPVLAESTESQFKQKMLSMGGVSLGGMLIRKPLVSSTSPTTDAIVESGPIDEAKIHAFIDSALGESVDYSIGYHALFKTGVVLLRVAQYVRMTRGEGENEEPIKINNGKFKFCWYENVERYIHECERMGLHEKLDVDALIDGDDECEGVMKHLQRLIDITSIKEETE